MADVNRDGRIDIIYAANGQINVSLGQQDGSFQLVTTPLRLPFYTGLFNVSDVNNDGKPDLIFNYRDHLEIWFGNGDGTFTFSSSVNIQGLVSDVVAVLADLDGDGDADLVLAPDSNPGVSMGPLTIFYGNGNGTFQSPVFIPVSHRYSQVTAVDVNRDNKLDLVMTDGAGIAVMMNLGARKFDSEVHYVAGRSVSALNVVDVNSDGFPDIVVANSGGAAVTVLLNEPNGAAPGGAPVSGVLSVTPEPSVAGHPFTITLSVSGQTSGAPVPTGSVGISFDGAFVANLPLMNGSANYTYTIAAIPVPHTITATYNGDNIYAPKTLAVSHVVQPPSYPTQTSLAASASTLLASQTLRLSATVTSSPSVAGGIVTFLNGNSTLGSATIDASGTAYFDTALLTAGVHSLSAKFQGSTQYGFNSTTPYVAAIFSPSTSALSPITVTANLTTISLTASANSATAGTVLTLTSQVSSNAGAPFGGVSFYDGNARLGTLSLESNGSASFSTASLSTGSHSLTAALNANGPFGGSTSQALNISVMSAAATTFATLVSLAPQLNPESGIPSLIATVSPAVTPSGGTVTFLDGGKILGAAPVDGSGFARLANVQMNAGNHMMTASFGGASQYAPSVSPVITEQWPSTGPGFSLLVAAMHVPAVAPALASLEVEIAPLGTFGQGVGLSCASDLPKDYSCSFSPEALSGSGKSLLTILPASNSVRQHSHPIGWPGVTAGLFFGLLLGSGMRRPSRLLVFLFVGSLTFALSGCGSYAASPETARTIVLTVQAFTTGGSETIIHSAQIPVRLAAGK